MRDGGDLIMGFTSDCDVELDVHVGGRFIETIYLKANTPVPTLFNKYHVPQFEYHEMNLVNKHNVSDMNLYLISLAVKKEYKEDITKRLDFPDTDYIYDLGMLRLKSDDIKM
jgi:hypothetical protein